MIHACVNARPVVFPSHRSRLKLKCLISLPPTSQIVSYSASTRTLEGKFKKERHKSDYSGIITTEEYFPGYHSNQFTCALRLTAAIYFTMLSLLKSFNIKQGECHQLQLMLCFPPLLILSELGFIYPPCKPWRDGIDLSASTQDRVKLM